MTPHDPQDVPVRIGDLHALAPASADRLVAVGLGSCAGVAVVDERSGACALAHVFLPELPPGGARAGAGDGTYADTAVPRLVERVRALVPAGSKPQLVAVVAGGARMFGARPGNDVGERNVAAVRAALAAAGVPIAAEDVGGTSGRTVRASGAGSGAVRVTVRAVGTEERELWTGRTVGAAVERLAA